MTASLADDLRRENDATWQAAVDHRFMRGIRAGALPDDVMARFLIQDYRFLETFLELVAGGVVLADTLAAKLPYGQALGALCSDENTFFTRAMNSLGIDQARLDGTPNTAPTASFLSLMQEAVESRTYAAVVSVLCVANGLYLDCASKAETPPTNPMHAEWIGLHHNDAMRAFVAFVRSELDRVGPAHDDLCRQYFQRAVTLEKAFLDALYEAESR